jgi:hypothetical protein
MAWNTGTTSFPAHCTSNMPLLTELGHCLAVSVATNMPLLRSCFTTLVFHRKQRRTNNASSSRKSYQSKIGESSHEPSPPNLNLNPNPFMAPMRVQLWRSKSSPEPQFARALPTILPLPFRRGEGRGEGSIVAVRFMAGEQVREEQGASPDR